MMYPQSDAILDKKTGETLVYSELLKGNRKVMPSGYPMHPQSGLLRSKDGNDIDLVELLSQRSSGGQDGTGGGSDLKSHINTVVLEEPVNTIRVTADKNNVSFAELNLKSISLLIFASYETSGFNYATLQINGKSIYLGQNAALYPSDGVYKVDFVLNDDGTANVLFQTSQYGRSTYPIAFGTAFDNSYNTIIFGDKIEKIEFFHTGGLNFAINSKMIIYGR